jgi:hypothetical protein
LWKEKEKESRSKQEKSARHWWLTPVVLATEKAEIRRIEVGSKLGQIVHKTLFQQHSTQNMAGGAHQVVESLPSNHKALISNPNTEKKERKERKKKQEKSNFNQLSTECLSIPSRKF